MSTGSIEIPPIREAEFVASATLRGECIWTKLSGSADGRVTELLSRLFLDVHIEATRIGIARVTLDLTELEFMNAPCFRSLVTWISMVLEAERPYAITLLSDPAMLWQKRSLQTLSCFAADLITVTTSRS